jgi:hypothetical protein
LDQGPWSTAISGKPSGPSRLGRSGPPRRPPAKAEGEKIQCVHRQLRDHLGVDPPEATAAASAAGGTDAARGEPDEPDNDDDDGAEFDDDAEDEDDEPQPETEGAIEEEDVDDDGHGGDAGR